MSNRIHKFIFHQSVIDWLSTQDPDAQHHFVSKDEFSRNVRVVLILENSSLYTLCILKDLI